ncbi:Polycystin cation channel PKD1/PKD2 [Trinorchestia longiramus]|nr:Polycystin cation channel PKD1/PKD2 [Trinorchestia longiramus]
MFGVILLVAEVLPGGGITPTFKYQGFNLLRYHGGGGVVVLVCEICFVIFICFFARREYQTFKKEGRQYFSIFWNYLEVIVIFLALIAIVFYLIKTAYTYWLLDMLKQAKRTKNIRMQSLAVFDKTLTQLIGIMLFIVTVKLLRLLRFNKRIGYLSETLKLAGPEVLAFLFILIISLTSFVTVFYILCRNTSLDFSTFLKSIEAAFFIIDQKFDDILVGNRVIGPIFYFGFCFIIFFIVFPFLIAIICSAFSTIKADLSAQPNDHEVVEYMMTLVAAFTRRLRPNVSHDQKLDVEIVNNLDYINTKLEGTLRELNRNSKTYQSPFW